MTDKEIKEFTDELKRYRMLLGLSARLKEKLDLLFYDLTGVKGVSFDRISGTTNSEQTELQRLTKIDEYNDVLRTYEAVNKRIKNIQKVLNCLRIEDREMFMMKYLDNMSFYAIAKVYYISKTGLIYRMNEALRKVEL